MCGIIGVITENKEGLTAEHYDAFKDAWRKAEDRGTHASGYIASTGKRLEFWKWARPSSDSVAILESVMPYRKGLRFLLAHTRWATSGDPEDNINNHPLVVGPGKDLMGIHNGVIINKEDLLDQMKWREQRGVDTEIIFRLIHRFGMASLKPFQMLRGLFNLAYTARKTPGEFNLVRKGNPLTLKVGKDFLAFGSMDHYWQSLEGNNVPIEDNTVMRVTPNGIASIKKFKPASEWWEQRTRTIAKRDCGSEMDEWERLYRQDHQEAFVDSDGEARMIDPETGSLERVRDLWPQ